MRQRIACRLGAILLLLSFIPSTGGTEIPEEWAEWNRPMEPFRIAGDIYYVGAQDIAAYLLTSEEGHILLDGGFESTAPLIARSIKRLGFRIEDVRWLLNSHAHLDHAGGLAALARLSGAEFAASRRAAPALETGGPPANPFPPIVPDRKIEDGDTISSGGIVMTAHVTPGHTPGCTTWTTRITHESRSLDVVFLCSVSLPPDADLLGEDPEFPEGRAEAFRGSFERLESLPVDVFLAPHASFFRMHDKLAAKDVTAADRFIDPDLYHRHLRGKRQHFEASLREQRETLSKNSGLGDTDPRPQ